MFKIILADDEPIIIKGLRKMIHWEKLNAEIVAEARNGEELLGKIREFNPDIVISDVAMPKMTGLDVIKAIKQEDRNIKVIFLSGYQEFDYVKTAIKYEAMEYLLKPVGKEELEQAILKAEQMLKASYPIEYWQEEKNDMQTVFRKMNSEYECKELYEHFKEMGLETEGKRFVGVCFALSADFRKKIGNQNMFELVRFSVFKKIQEYLNREKNGFVIKREPNSCNLILLEDTEEQTEKEIMKIREKVYEEYETWLITGIGKTVDTISELKFAYKTAKFSVELHYFCEYKIIRYKDISKEFNSSFEDYNNCYKEMIKRILNKDPEWKKSLEQVLDTVESLHYGNRYAAENRCIAMAMNFYRDLSEYKILGDDQREDYDLFVAKIRAQDAYRELKRFISRYLGCLMEDNIGRIENTEKETICQVKQYIQEHYAEEISLGKISEVVYMNPYYFSTFFKKETGQNYKNYVIEVRMKEAMKLLMETDMKTYELAKAVGYNDVRSFTEKFKEFYGESPSGYKKAKKV